MQENSNDYLEYLLLLLINQRIKIVEKNAKKHGITILLKGSTDVISNGFTTYLYEKTIPAMTVGGTGDVLSGLVVGMLSKNRNTLESAAAATFINGLAGKVCSKEIGIAYDFDGSTR